MIRNLIVKALIVLIIGMSLSTARAVDKAPPPSTAKPLPSVNVTASPLPDLDWNFVNELGDFGTVSISDTGGGGAAHTSVNSHDTANNNQNKNPCSVKHHDPIMLDTGSKVDTITDFSEPGEMGLRFVRYYDSRMLCSNGSTCNGYGSWSSNLDYKFVANCDFVIKTGCTGIGVVYQDPSGASYYSNPTQHFYDTTGETISIGTATVTNSGNGLYTVHTENGDVLTFQSDGGNSFSTPSTIKDRNGIGWTLTHPNNTTTVVTHTDGQSFSIVESNASTGYGVTKTITVTDPEGNVYTYDTEGISSADPDPVSHLDRIDSVALPGTPSTNITYTYYPDNTSSNPVVIAQLEGVYYNGVEHDVTTYDSSGRATTDEIADGSEKTSIVYGSNSTGPTATVTNPLGQVSVYQFNGSKLLVSITGQATSHCAASYASNSYDSNGFMTSSTDADGNVTNYTYDSNGLLQKKVEAAGTPVQRTIDYVWDTTTPGDVKISSITVEGWQKQAFTYDANNRLASVTATNLSGSGTSNEALTTTFVRTLYSDGMVHTLTITHPSPNDSDQDVYTYDTLGHISTVADALGHTTTYSNYNALGEPRKIVGPNGDETDYTYDPRGRVVTKVTHPNGTTATWTYGYDGFGLLSSETDPDGKVTLWSRDATTMRVSVIGRTEHDGDSTESFGYDANGDVTSDVIQRDNDVGLSETMVYDALGRLYQKKGQNGQVQTFTYDANNNVIAVTSAAGTAVSYQYDPLNRVSKEIKSDDAIFTPTSAPSLTVPSGTNGTGNYTVNWSSIAGASSYQLESQINGGSWSAPATIDSTSDGITGKSNGTYGYQVRACNAAGCGPWSSTQSVTVLLPPGTPSNITVPATSNGPITISWASSSTATSYTLQLQYNGGSWTGLNTLSGTSYSYTATSSGDHVYRVKACNSSGCSGYVTSSDVVVTIPPASAPSLTVPSTSSTGNYTVSWGTVSGATSYTLQEQVNGGSWSTSYTGSGTSKSYSKANGNYGYRIEACNAGGCSGWSSTKTIAVQIPPQTPTTLSVILDHQSVPDVRPPERTSINMSWSSSANATSYDLNYCYSGNCTTVSTSSLSDSVSVANTTTSAQASLRACNAAGCSAWEGPIQATVVNN